MSQFSTVGGRSSQLLSPVVKRCLSDAANRSSPLHVVGLLVFFLCVCVCVCVCEFASVRQAVPPGLGPTRGRHDPGKSTPPI